METGVTNNQANIMIFLFTYGKMRELLFLETLLFSNGISL